jgi:hypothetical protein
LGGDGSYAKVALYYAAMPEKQGVSIMELLLRERPAGL